MKVTILDNFFKKSKLDKSRANVCSECGIEVPEHIVVCWNCGEILDENIKRLFKNK